MDAIRIKNLRSLVDTGEIEIKPLTVLVGANSAGKSTFLRSFPLLRQSSEQKTINDILWFGDYVDFGSFTDSVNRDEAIKAERKEISFEFKFNLDATESAGFPRKYIEMKFGKISDRLQSCVFKLRQSCDVGVKDADVYSEYEIELDGNKATLSVDQDLVIKRLIMNGEEVIITQDEVRLTRQKDLLPSIAGWQAISNSYEAKVLECLRPLVHGKVANEKIMTAVSSVYYGSTSFIFKQLRRMPLGDTYVQRFSQLKSDSSKIKLITEYYFAIDFWRIFNSINSVLSSTFSNIRYITPLRASAERYYRLQGLAVDEIAPNGENLAMYLKSLSDIEAADFAEWTKKYMGFAVRVESHSGHVSIVIEDPRDNTFVNLADVGFGYSQVIPILAQMWQIQRVKVQKAPHIRSQIYEIPGRPIFFLIEQPELHLHPKMQGRLGELLLRSSIVSRQLGIDLRIIVETHSETLIAKLGQLISRKTRQTQKNKLENADGNIIELIPGNLASKKIAELNFSENDIGVYLFGENKTLDSSPSIVKSGFDKDGLLLDWPYDFFDGVQ